MEMGRTLFRSWAIVLLYQTDEKKFVMAICYLFGGYLGEPFCGRRRLGRSTTPHHCRQGVAG